MELGVGARFLPALLALVGCWMGFSCRSIPSSPLALLGVVRGKREEGMLMSEMEAMLESSTKETQRVARFIENEAILTQSELRRSFPLYSVTELRTIMDLLESKEIIKCRMNSMQSLVIGD